MNFFSSKTFEREYMNETLVRKIDVIGKVNKKVKSLIARLYNIFQSYNKVESKSVNVILKVKIVNNNIVLLLTLW